MAQTPASHGAKRKAALMHSFGWITIFWAESPALSLASRRGPRTCHASFPPRMAHGPRHRTLTVGDGVGHDVGGNLLPECSSLAAGTRRGRIPARIAAHLLRKDATGFRALGLKPASLLRTAQASLPVPRSHRAPAGQGQKQKTRGGQLRNGLRALGQNRFRRCPPALPRPTGGLFARFARFMSRPPVGRASRLEKHRVGRALGRSLRWRSLGLAPASRVTGSVSAGALPSPCSAWGLRITLFGLGACANFRPPWRTKVSCHFSPARYKRPAHPFALVNAQRRLPCLQARGAPGARPIQIQSIAQTRINRDPNMFSKHDHTRFKE